MFQLNFKFQHLARQVTLSPSQIEKNKHEWARVHSQLKLLWRLVEGGQNCVLKADALWDNCSLSFLRVSTVFTPEISRRMFLSIAAVIEI